MLFRNVNPNMHGSEVFDARQGERQKAGIASQRGQDAQYQGPARSYTKLGRNGVVLSDSATAEKPLGAPWLLLLLN